MQDNYPEEPIRLIVSQAPGGAVETIVRKFQPYAEKQLGVPLMVECIDGGGGIIGTTVLQKSDPDGYTIQAKSVGSHINSWVFQEAPYGPDDFEYLARFSNDPGCILVRKDAPYDNLPDFIKWIKTRPEGSVTMSLANINDINFLGLKQIENAAGIKFNIVGYTGGGPARLAIVSGEVVGSHCNYFGAASVWDDTKVLALHQYENTIPALNGVQTVDEALGVKTQEISTNYLIILPKGFSEKYPERSKKLYNALYTAWNSPELKDALVKSGQDGYINVLDPEKTTKEFYEVNNYITSNKNLFN
jgi:tripartite-type tricarboxylate transporter receptor subunit TctC